MWSTDLKAIAAGFQRLELATQRPVLLVQRMFITVSTGLDHLHSDLDVTQGLTMSHSLILLYHQQSQNLWFVEQGLTAVFI